MKSERLKIKFTGVVTQHYISEEGKHVFKIQPTRATIEKIMDRIQEEGAMWDGDNFPIKENADGSNYIKTSSGFKISCMGETEDVSEVGVGSEVTAYTVWQENRYQRKRYVACYLSGLNVHELEYYDEYNPFTDESFESPSV